MPDGTSKEQAKSISGCVLGKDPSQYANDADHWPLADLAILGTSKQARRMTRYLLQNPRAITVDVARNAGVINLSDCASHANKTLHRVGLQLACESPVRPLKNRFGEDSSMVHWSVFVLPEGRQLVEVDAANDSEIKPAS